MRNLIFPEDLPEPKKQLRHAREFSVITPPPKPNNEIFYHCEIHRGTRLVRVSPGLWMCPISCGPTSPATRTVLAT